MALYSVYRVSKKHQVRNFRLPGSAWGLLIKVEHFRINNFWISKRNMKKYRTAGHFKFSHFAAGTSATLTVCITILICCFVWTTTSTTLSSASSSPRAGNFNWPLFLFNKDGKLQLKKIDEWMKTWWINIFTFFEMLARIFVFLFSNNRSISVYCLGMYKINGFIWFHARLKRIELFYTELFWQVLQIHRRKRRYF